MLSLSDIISYGFKYGYLEWDKTRRYTKSYKFINNSKNYKNLILVLAGYQDYVWDTVFGRIKKYCPSDYDVCIVSSGKYVPVLAELAKKNKWSYLSTKVNKLAMALNTAIKLHPEAEYIYKLDEDIFLGRGFFEGLLNTYKEAEQDKLYHVGIVAPTMNINGASYRHFLSVIGKLDEYESKFGTATISCDDDKVFSSAESAKYLWNISLPLDSTIETFRTTQSGYFPSPIRYSIGAIMLTRNIWDDMGGFKSSGNGKLAWDEFELCKYCMVYSRAIIVSKSVFAGHFGFRGQKTDMVPFFNANKEKF